MSTMQTDLQSSLSAIRKNQAEDVAKKKAAQLGVAYISLQQFPVSQEAVALIPLEDAHRLRLIAFFFDGDNVHIATTHPETSEVKNYCEEIAKNLSAKLTLYLISDNGFDEAVTMYERLPKTRNVVSGVEITQDDLLKFSGILTSFSALQEKVASLNMSDLVVMIIAAALEGGASDIHAEAGMRDGVVRLRIDGILHEVVRIPSHTMKKMVDRLKLASKLKINITDKPQDGRFTIQLKEGNVDVRVSVLPTEYGESMVMRLLRPGSIALTFEDLGLLGKSYVILKQQIVRPNGMIITTGPTGSGKTTTLYAILRFLNKESTKIITLENPVEYKLEGIAQSGIDESKDYTFAKGLKSLLRQDPDVVMVGEIRDLETADVAIQAALTGHLMLSTIHTNSAAGSVPRFLGMGVKPFLLPPSLNAVIGQRLVRRLCQSCKVATPLDSAIVEKVLLILAVLPKDAGYEIDLSSPIFYTAPGCATCMGLGYKGRVGIYEVFTMNKDMAKEIESGVISEYRLQALAEQQGMVTMAQDGLVKAAMGLTSVEEVLKVAEQKSVDEQLKLRQDEVHDIDGTKTVDSE